MVVAAVVVAAAVVLQGSTAAAMSAAIGDKSGARCGTYCSAMGTVLEPAPP